MCVLEKNQEKKLELSQWREFENRGAAAVGCSSSKEKIAVAAEGKEKKLDCRFCFRMCRKLQENTTRSEVVSL